MSTPNCFVYPGQMYIALSGFFNRRSTSTWFWLRQGVSTVTCITICCLIIHLLRSKHITKSSSGQKILNRSLLMMLMTMYRLLIGAGLYDKYYTWYLCRVVHLHIVLMAFGKHRLVHKNYFHHQSLSQSNCDQQGYTATWAPHHQYIHRLAFCHCDGWWWYWVIGPICCWNESPGLLCRGLHSGTDLWHTRTVTIFPYLIFSAYLTSSYLSTSLISLLKSPHRTTFRLVFASLISLG